MIRPISHLIVPLDARNTGVTLVQFVMATDAVEAPQEEQTVADRKSVCRERV